jgi:hypothetical protein
VDVGRACDGQWLVSGRGADGLGDEIKEWFDGGAPVAQTFGVGFVLDVAVVGLRVTSFAPLVRWGEEDDTGFSPTADAPGLSIAVVGGQALRTQLLEDAGLLVVDDCGLRHGTGLDLYQSRKGRVIAGDMQPIAIDPTRIATPSPTGVGVQVAQFGRTPSCLTITLVPDRSPCLEGTFIDDQVLRPKRFVQFSRLLPHELHKGSYHRVELLVTPRQRGPVGHAFPAQHGPQLGMCAQPAPLRFELEDTSKL